VCRADGHIAKDCPKKFGGQKGVAASVVERGRGGYPGRPGFVNRGGHRGRGQGGRGSGRGSYDNSGSYEFTQPDNENVGCFVQRGMYRGSEVLSPEEDGELPVVSAVGSGSSKRVENMPVAKGFVDG